jgi:hypothetical protein
MEEVMAIGAGGCAASPCERDERLGQVHLAPIGEIRRPINCR